MNSKNLDIIMSSLCSYILSQPFEFIFSELSFPSNKLGSISQIVSKIRGSAETLNKLFVSKVEVAKWFRRDWESNKQRR